MNECTLVLHRLRCGGKEMMNEWSALTGQQEGNTLHNRWTACHFLHQGAVFLAVIGARSAL